MHHYTSEHRSVYVKRIILVRMIMSRVMYVTGLTVLLYSQYCSAGFAAKGGGGFGGSSKPKAKSSSSGGRGGGFGKITASKAKSGNTSIHLKSIDLGRKKSINIYVPPDEMLKQKPSDAKSQAELLQKFRSFYGTGDVLWPSSLQLGRLVAHCPSFVRDKHILEIGCGLGLVSAAALLGSPKSVMLSDVDESVLDLAVRSCTESSVREWDGDIPVKKCRIDWFDKSTWPTATGEDGEELRCCPDMILASDVLYSDKAVEPLAELMAHFMLHHDDHDDHDGVLRQAMIVDPIQRVHRDAFLESAEKVGLLVEIQPFPGQPDEFVLIHITPA
mmetsp:Transcript_7707/g.11230  ORF Transcript_7707/g.11230 Transcript_7707/m.11230 type:complete len:330 (-) Transcript_7707:254-1243(-)